MLSYEKIFENNRKWLEKKKAKADDFFEKLAEEQNPEFLIIGCSDSRVPLENITGADPGEIFVHRNIANIVSKSDPNVLSAIEFAITNLKVKHIVVCGHSGCGGVKAAMNSEDEGSNLGTWLSNVRYVIQRNSEELNNLNDDDRYNRLIELNTITQAENIRSMELVKKSRSETGYPKIHAWIYNIETGALDDLDY